MSELFNSYTDPIPPLRYDVQRIPFQQNGHELIYFFDTMGYATPEFALPSDAETILQLMDGTRSVEDILKFSSEEISKEQILGYVRFLDEHRLLQSSHFRDYSGLLETEYEKSDYHHSNTAGVSFPADPDELNTFLNEAFESNPTLEPVDSARALYAPHIDPRVGMSSYVKAFSAIRNLTPKRVIILATSHYAGLYGSFYQDDTFIVADKKFKMPNGILNPDSEAIGHLQDHYKKVGKKSGLSFNARAHRTEHSIEMHLLFLNHIWDHDFKIVPILVGGIDEVMYSDGSFREQQIQHFSKLLRDEFANDPDTFFLISGDLSHIGKKFGDEKTASELFEEIEDNDKNFIEAGAKGDPGIMLKVMKSNYDAYRICGFPPLYTFLNIFDHIEGEILTYDLWNEKERESAVSFSALIYS